MSRLLLAVGLWRLCAAYPPIGKRRCLVPLRAETEDRAEQIKKLNDMFYGSTMATEADADELSDLPLWRVQWNALPGERQVYNVHVPTVWKSNGRGSSIQPAWTRTRLTG